MKTYYYRPIGLRYTYKLTRLKDPITLCQRCAAVEFGNVIITTKHIPKEHCDRCEKETPK